MCATASRGSAGCHSRRTPYRCSHRGSHSSRYQSFTSRFFRHSCIDVKADAQIALRRTDWQTHRPPPEVPMTAPVWILASVEHSVFLPTASLLHRREEELGRPSLPHLTPRALLFPLGSKRLRLRRKNQRRREQKSKREREDDRRPDKPTIKVQPNRGDADALCNAREAGDIDALITRAAGHVSLRRGTPR